jgi:hypothetical protein
MTSASTAFGRSLPADLLPASGLSQAQQLWKVNDEKAGKNGNCQAVYWVKERPNKMELKRHAKPEKKWETGSICQCRARTRARWSWCVWSLAAHTFVPVWFLFLF